MVGYGGKDLQKRKVLSLEWKSKGVMDDASGESMELMEEVPLKELGLGWVANGVQVMPATYFFMIAASRASDQSCSGILSRVSGRT